MDEVGRAGPQNEVASESLSENFPTDGPKSSPPAAGNNEGPNKEPPDPLNGCVGGKFSLFGPCKPIVAKK
jgi:hypothetical protein